MKIFVVIAIALCCSLFSYGQKSRFSLSAHYGVQGNFFVRSYDEAGGPSVPNQKYFYKKKFIGSIGGLELKYDLTSNASVGLAFSRTINKGRKNWEGQNGDVELIVDNFQIRNTEDFYQLYYERNFVRNHPAWKYHAGVVYARMQQQEIDNLSNVFAIRERNTKSDGLEEAGVFGGIQYAKKIDTHFDLGIKARVYYLISVQQLEAVSLTPVLTYHF